jgi:26S proteasome regulatory subunit T1
MPLPAKIDATVTMMTV